MIKWFLTTVKSLFYKVETSLPCSAVVEPPPEGRSSKWPKARKEHLAREPQCQVCGTDKTLTVHHIIPFHLNPDLELVESNFITLCEGTDGGCHRRIGHWYDWSAYNPDIRYWASLLRKQIKGRPYKLPGN